MLLLLFKPSDAQHRRTKQELLTRECMNCKFVTGDNEFQLCFPRENQKFCVVILSLK